MIKANRGEVTLKGTDPELLMELTCIIKALIHIDVKPEMIEEAYRFAFMSEDELKKEAFEKIKKLIEGKKGE